MIAHILRHLYICNLHRAFVFCVQYYVRGYSESKERLWERILQAFVSTNGNAQGRTKHTLSARFMIIQNSCFRYHEILKDCDMVAEAAILAYAIIVGKGFRWVEAYDIIYEYVS
ncbi:hypothetical protein MKW94_026160 [Papaver nudicaule]|uniref:Uncharacterized protein n=1 Tax=Papaver nudicaule TaxID=74823 RepID=A0AA41RU66_PAPNU|nr:hypothetical protein [Papaver nudicaule]